jgi:hypothetical protein
MNIDEMLALKDYVIRNPHDFDMELEAGMTRAADPNVYRDKYPIAHVLEPEKGCGTACCYAGTEYMLAHKLTSLDMLQKARQVGWNAIKTEVTDLLDLTPYQADVLFHIPYWPSEQRAKYKRATTDLERAEAGGQVIDIIIAAELAHVKALARHGT